jgi:hypothetical protein
MSALEQLVLNGTALNTTGGFYVLEGVDFTPPKKKPEWAQGADSDGAELIRTPLYENRTITATIRVVGTTMNQALEKFGELVDQLQEAEKNPQGIPLEWTPANSTKTITFYVLTGEVTSVPVVVEGSDVGWFVAMPKVGISMTCKPFGYGAEVEVAAAKSIETGLSVVVLTVPTVAGDIPAEGRLVITDTAAVGRRYVEWGLENRYYNASTSLIEAAEAMTPVGGTRSEAANTGAYSPSSTKKTIATTLVNEPTICLETGVLKHVGSFRVKARVQVVLGAESLAERVKLRLSYQDGEGPFRANPWQTPNLGGKYVEVDLGVITSTTAISGTLKWLGRIEAYSENGIAKDVLHVNYLTFIPVAEGYGKAVAPALTGGGTISAFDNFTTGTLSGSLNTRTPAVGAAWATSGAATDYAVAAGKVSRSTVTDTEPRLGVLGAALGNSSVRVEGAVENNSTASSLIVGALIRWTNASNYAFLELEYTISGKTTVAVNIRLCVRIAGVTTVLASTSQASAAASLAFSATITATLDGNLACTGAAVAPFSLTASSSAIATGGALASGKGGIYDQALGHGLRTFSSIGVTTLAGIPYSIQPSQSMEVRSDSTIAEDVTGTYTGPVQQYRGSRFFGPQDGSANRTSRMVVKADRNDLEESDQQTIADAFTAQVFATPRYGVIPR